MTEKVSDVVSQLEAVLAGIWQRVPHSDDCAIRGGFNPEAPCDCDRNTRLQVEIAKTWQNNFHVVSHAMRHKLEG